MSNFIPRTTAPTSDNRYYYADNPFYKAGYGMPNCTCYAWGRFYELCGEKPRLSLGNPENWYNYNDGYERGKTPRLGAIALWAKGQVGNSSDGAGHAAIVEQVNPDGSIVTSNSAWKSTNFYMKAYDNTYYNGSAFTFLGFIYNPIRFEDLVYETVTPISKNAWLTEAEMQTNAVYIYQYLNARGWSLNAIAGMLGNMEVESKINPGIWQNLNVGKGPAYGIVQWDPWTKYWDWCEARNLEPSEMDNNLNRIIWELENGEQYYPTKNYPETFREFSKSSKSANYLGWAFVYNYERPANPTARDRGAYAEKWYNYLVGVIEGGTVPPAVNPDEDIPENPDPRPLKLPVWLLYKFPRGRAVV